MKDWQKNFLWILGILLLIWFIYEIRSIVILFFITGALAYVVNPSVTKLARKLRLKKGISYRHLLYNDNNSCSDSSHPDITSIGESNYVFSKGYTQIYMS
jgi:hypothetical protein